MTSPDSVFAESVSAMLRLAQADPGPARVALVARGDQVLAALRESVLPAARDSQRIVALVDLYVQATFEMLFEAALVLMTHRGMWSWLKAWGMKIARHRGMKRAIVAVARRLAVIMHRMWVDGTEFRWSRKEAAAA